MKPKNSLELLNALIEIKREMFAYGELYEAGGSADKKWRRSIKRAEKAIANATRGQK